MKTIFIIFILSFFSTTSFAGFVTCYSGDESMKVSINSQHNSVLAVKFCTPTYIKSIDESLPAGIYANGQEINEQVNWYFEDEAFISIKILPGTKQANITILGNDNTGPSRAILSKTLNCEQAL